MRSMEWRIIANVDKIRLNLKSNGATFHMILNSFEARHQGSKRHSKFHKICQSRIVWQGINHWIALFLESHLVPVKIHLQDISCPAIFKDKPE